MNIIDYIVNKLNLEPNVEFRKNFVLDFSHSAKQETLFTVFDINREQIEMDAISYVPVSEVVSTPTPFVEKNERTGWIKTLAFPLVIEDGYQFRETNAYFQALVNLTNDLNGIWDTIGDKKVSFKVTYPRYDTKALNGGKWYAIFVIDFYLTAITSGFFTNDYTIEMKRTTDETYTELDYVEFTLPVGADGETIPNVFDNNNTKDKQTRYTTQFSLSFNYFGGDLEDELYSYQMGKGDATKQFDLKLTHQSGVYEYTVSISAGAPLWKRGTVDRVSIDMKEV